MMGGVKDAILDEMVQEGLSTEKTLDLNEISKKTMQTFEERAFQTAETASAKVLRCRWLKQTKQRRE